MNIEDKMLECVAEAYAVDKDSVKLDTDIRDELSNVSMKLLVLISTIEEEFDVELTMAQMGSLRTPADLAAKVSELMGK